MKDNSNNLSFISSNYKPPEANIELKITPATSAAPLLQDVSTTAAATSDDWLIELWLHNRSPHTIRAYRRDIGRLRTFIGHMPLPTLTLGELQAFNDSLSGSDASRGRVMASVKSLLSFAAKLGAIPFNVGGAIRKIKTRDTLADRILDEQQVARMLALSEGRDHALVRLAYAGGFRVSELVALQWSDCADAPDGGLFVAVFGKGGKTRVVRVSPATASVVRALRGDAEPNVHVFVGRRGGLSAVQAWRIVRAAAERAGIEKSVSPHFLRHAHASHALERGAKVTTIRDTLGHSSIAVTDRYAHARPGEYSGAVLPV